MNDYIDSIRKDFPVLGVQVEGKNLVYLDNGASAQKPQVMIDAISKFYSKYYSNIHRSAHTLSRLSTTAYEAAREAAKKYFNVPESAEVVYTRGTTESLNIVAACFGQKVLKKNDVVVVSEMEHHANLVPWQEICKKTGAVLKFAKITENGELSLESLEEIFKQGGVKIVSIAHCSNVLGTVNDVRKISEMCRQYNSYFSVDAAQSAPHFLDDFAATDADFMSLSAHKCYGPTGFGLLIAKKSVFEIMDVYQCGGDMVDHVDWQYATYKKAPEKFEAGSQHIAGAIGFMASLNYLSKLDKAKIKQNEKQITEFLTERLSAIKGLRVLGSAKNKLPIFSFVHENAAAYDIAALLDTTGIALRSGNHCAQPLGRLLNAPVSCRASFGLYNTLQEAEYFVAQLEHALKVLA